MLRGQPVSRALREEVEGGRLRKPQDRNHLLTMMGTYCPTIATAIHAMTVKILRAYERLEISWHG